MHHTHKNCNGSCPEESLWRLWPLYLLPVSQHSVYGAPGQWDVWRALAPLGFPSSQPLSPEWNQLAPWRGPAYPAERPMNTSSSPPSCRPANQHWHSHSLSTLLSVTPHLRFDGHLIELQICLEKGYSQSTLGGAVFLQRDAIAVKPQHSLLCRHKLIHTQYLI